MVQVTIYKLMEIVVWALGHIVKTNLLYSIVEARKK